MSLVVAHRNGDFFLADSHKALEEALASIQQAEKHAIESEPVYIKTALYHWPLAFALLWIIAWQTVPLLRSGR